MATQSLDQRIVQTPGVCGGKPRIDILTTIEGVVFEQAWPERLEVEGMQLAVIGRRHLLENKRALGRTQDQADLERLRGDGS